MSTPHNKRSNEDFIKLSNIKHNNFYDYSKTIYVNNRTPVIITCPAHGDFKQIPEHHLNGSGCPECKGNKKLNTKTFIEKSNKVHNNFYDYSNVEYKSNKVEVDIICPIHGHFSQRPDSHLRGIGCPFCGQIKSADSQRKSLETFVVDANKIHGFKYDYTNSVYNGAHKNMEIKCLKHGIFEQTPNSHLKGCGCPKCIETYGERNIRMFLQENNIFFKSQKTFTDCRYKGLLKFDFYLTEYNTCIEFDGKQHFSPYYVFGGVDSLELQKIKDKIKTDYCNNNDILLFRISYEDKIEKKLKELLEILSKK